MSSTILTIIQEIPTCERCPRLREWCRSVAENPPKRHLGETYWGKPVPPFGDPDAEFLIVGLAPAANGANRTGRMFTGDRSGDWLYRALYKAGVASQESSVSSDDGLTLTNTLIVATCHCAPPDNKPTPEEIRNCSFWINSVVASRTWTAILCLGSIGWISAHRSLGMKAPKFGHGVTSVVGDTRLVGCYHPSQQNTFTGRLTETMLDDAVAKWLKD